MNNMQHKIRNWIIFLVQLVTSSSKTDNPSIRDVKTTDLKCMNNSRPYISFQLNPLTSSTARINTFWCSNSSCAINGHQFQFLASNPNITKLNTKTQIASPMNNNIITAIPSNTKKGFGFSFNWLLIRRFSFMTNPICLPSNPREMKSGNEEDENREIHICRGSHAELENYAWRGRTWGRDLF